MFRNLDCESMFQLLDIPPLATLKLTTMHNNTSIIILKK